MNNNWIQITDFRGRLVFINLDKVCSVIFCDIPDNEHVTLNYDGEHAEKYTGEAIEHIKQSIQKG